MELLVREDMAKYLHVRLSVDEALKLLNILTDIYGREVKDVKEAKRIIENFDVFFDVARKKFKSYLVIPHDVSDMIRGEVIVDKVRLVKEDNRKIVELVFDRRVNRELILESIKRLGYTPKIVK
ncbi:MAG TPA: hypothetical protein EYH40_04810 [Desulfurococcales archaeon]|nr:hypothetical protein [Desulfurococcales archaeon]